MIDTYYFEPYQDRRLEHTQRVQVYRNVNKKGVVYSIRDAKSKLVLGHGMAILLSNCKFHVSQAGRERVLREGKKNIHAWIEGNYVGPYYADWLLHYGPDADKYSEQVYYSPWIHEQFMIYRFEPETVMVNFIEPIYESNLVLAYKTITAHVERSP